MTTMTSANEQSSDGDIDNQSIVCQANPHQVESRFATMESIESVQIDSLSQLSQVSEVSGAGSHDEHLPVVLNARLSGEISVSAPSDTRYSVILPQDPAQSQALLLEENSAALAISSGETGIRTDRPLEAMESHDQDVSTEMGTQDPTPDSPDGWFPYTLSWQYLSLLTFITLALMITVIVLYRYSVTHYGLWDVNDSAVAFFGWRFAPSLFAVIYVQMTAMLLEDVKRTEPFARMARPGGAPGESTILQSTGAWWNALFDGISKKKNVGRRSWVLISSSLVNILGFLTISPLSASLLEPISVDIVKPTNFTILSNNSTLQLSAGRETYLRILGNILQNVSTSAWITDEYVAFPVWPSHLDRIPLGTSLSSAPESWQAETIIMNTDLDCRRMELKGTTAVQYPFISLSSKDGCIFNITIDSMDGYALWGQYPDDNRTSTSDCGHGEFIMSIAPDLNISAHICSPNYYMAKMTITVHSTGTLSSISFDENTYIKERIPIPFNTLNTDSFQQILLSSNWSMYIPHPTSDIYTYTPTSIDLSALTLAAVYDFNTERMAKDKSLMARVKRIRQRVFGEVLQHSLLEQYDPKKSSFNGQVKTVERRILVIAGVAITVAVILQISSILLILVWILSRRRRRVLNLSGDPAKATTVCSLITNQPNVRQTLLGFDRNPEEQVYTTIRENSYRTSHRGLHEIRHSTSRSAEQLNTNSSTGITSIPVVLRLKTLFGLLVTLLLVLISLLVVYSLARRSNLHQAFFTYEASIRIFGRKSATVAPLSIIPTLVAVGIGLWWSSVDAMFRKLQPLLSMANAPTNAARGVALSYQSSYWVAATVKAASNQHWFLCFITIGTSLSQILTISMSALFQRSQSRELTSVVTERSLEIRDVPFTYESWSPSMTYIDQLPHEVIKHLFTELSTNWLYSATLESAFNARQPRWSRDGWSFVPLNTHNLTTGHISEQPQTSPFQPMVNITVQTPAIRARLECFEYDVWENRAEWLLHADTINPLRNQSTIPTEISGVYELGETFFNTSFLTYPRIIQCCSNGTVNSTKRVAIGYWSLDNSALPYTTGPQDISIKWVYGDGVWRSRRVYKNVRHKLLFSNVPAMSAIRCTPVIETSEANVTVRGDTGEVQSLTILSKAEKYDKAWSNTFVHDDITYGRVNSTTSFGVLFERSLLTSADIQGITDMPEGGIYSSYENLQDQSFNFRDPGKGLNFDFMTYSMYMKAGSDPNAFTNVSNLEKYAQEAFSTFFQHYVSSNVSPTTGSWAYQPINATLPAELGAANPNVTTGYPGNTNYSVPHSHTNRTAIIQVSTPIEVLEVNAVALWLSSGIIIWLIMTTLIISGLQRRYLRNLNRNIDCLGDVLVLVAGSDKLLQLVNEIGPSGLDGEKDIFTRLGWFEDEKGHQRWGIEVSEGPGDLDTNIEASEQVTSTTAGVPSSYELLPIQSWRS